MRISFMELMIKHTKFYQFNYSKYCGAKNILKILKIKKIENIKIRKIRDSTVFD